VSADFLPADWPVPANILAGTVLRDSGYRLPAAPSYLQQLHGKRVVRLGSGDFAEGAPQADAVIGCRDGDLCLVKTADCLPVLLCGGDGREIAAIHAGWRGLAAGVIEATVADMTTAPERLLAWLGPAISQAAFEVGTEERDASISHTRAAQAAFITNDRGRWQADLYELAMQRLREAGVRAIFGGRLCTVGDPDRFYSCRRDGDTGRLLSFVYLRPARPAPAAGDAGER
jgi:YfiH family protein